SAFHLDGSMVSRFPKLIAPGLLPSAATAVDLDGDGVLDLVGAGMTNVGGTVIHRWAVAGATETGAAPWPMLRVDAHNAGLGPAAVRCTKTQAPSGMWCKGDSECASGSCSDGVCCATACTGSCFGCAEPGAEGVCTVRQSKLETDASCPDRQCTVARSCTSGTSCGRVVAPDGYPCGVGDKCRGGVCVAQQVDAGTPSAPMTPKAPQTGPMGFGERGPCGCSAAGGPLLLVWVLVVRRRRRV
ncbi:MAG: VCBS repeat-containing protein, partial [Myxococcaceae bacterium]|nr:VCBS repeat-containing protein [Myxococcaceae bacterium]